MKSSAPSLQSKKSLPDPPVRTSLYDPPPLQLPDSTRIWRYMDFPKFVALLEYGSSCFCRVDKLGDAFEGSYPKPEFNPIIWR